MTTISALVISLAASGFSLAAIPTGLWVFFSSVVMLVLTKTAEGWLKRKSEERSDRQDYRSEIKELRERVDAEEQQVGLWRDRYYAEQTVNAGLRVILIRNNINPNDHSIIDAPLDPGVPSSKPPSQA